jgi:RNA polymerase sigma-70 factor (ECF subfamily)
MLKEADDELAAAARDGDRAALEELLRRNFERVYVICRRITCHPEDAKDATQEALIVHRKLASFDGRSSFSTWLYRVATNAALDEVRRRRRRPLPIQDPGAVLARRAGQPTVEQILSDRLDIDEALGSLGPDFRAPVVLRDLYGLEYSTIAEVLGLPEGTVRSRLFRGRQAVRQLLQHRAPRPPGGDRAVDETNRGPYGSDEEPGEALDDQVAGHFAWPAGGLEGFVVSEEGWLVPVGGEELEAEVAGHVGIDPDQLIAPGDLHIIHEALWGGPVEPIDEDTRGRMIERGLE